jgi:hypothetical protein
MDGKKTRATITSSLDRGKKRGLPFSEVAKIRSLAATYA